MMVEHHHQCSLLFSSLRSHNGRCGDSDVENQTKVREDGALSDENGVGKFGDLAHVGKRMCKGTKVGGLCALEHMQRTTQTLQTGSRDSETTGEAFVQSGKKDDRCACDKMCRIDTVEPRKATGGGKEITFRCGRCGRG